MKAKLLLIVALSLMEINVFAQVGKLYDTDNQLSSSLINSIYQDHEGRIWIGTRNGLNVYDGYQFRIFKKDNGNSNGLFSNAINCIMQLRGGSMLIGLSDALQIYDNDHFRTVNTFDTRNNKLPCYINCTLQRKNGDVLIGTSGRGILKMNGNTSAKQVAGTAYDIAYPRQMAEDDYGMLWVATQDKGIISISGNRQTSYVIDGVTNNSFMDICKDAKGDIYTASINGGLFRFNRSISRFEHVSAVGNLPIASLCVSRNGKLLLGSNGFGLYIYDPVTDMMTPNTFYSNEIDLHQSKVFSIMEDNSGNVWMGLLQKGVFMQPTHRSEFGYIGYKMGDTDPIGDACVMCVRYTKDGAMWVATDNNGLYLIDRNKKLQSHFTPNGSANSVPHTILGMAEGADGRLWVSSFLEGCGWIDRSSGTYHRLECTYGKASSVFDVAVDNHDNVWVATMGDGLKRVNLKTNQVKEYRSSKNRDVGLVNDFIAQLYLSRDSKRLYIGTTVGVCCINTLSDQWEDVLGCNHLIDGESVNAIMEDSRGNAWVGTSEGLYCISLKTKHIRKYTTEDGLADNSVASIEIDSIGRIWVSTSHGMSCFNPDGGKIINFYTGDGLQGNEFSEGVSSINGQGNLAFGGMGGVSFFDPLKIIHKRKQLSIYITNFAMGGENVVANMKSGYYTVTDTTVMKTKVFELSHQDNSFSINLSTLTYDNPERIYYLYSVNGEKWTKMQQGKNEITFSHIQPGTYHFRVKAIDNNSESAVREFTVIVHPAWYFSVWAEIVYVLMLACLMMWYLRMRRRKEQDRLRLQEHIHAEELSESKLRFFMNISHEIRTPMTLIVAPLLQLIKEDSDSHRHGIYEIIKRNAERILHLVNQMMDLRKIDKGQMVMRMKETNIVNFVQDMYTLFSQQAKTKNIAFKFVHDAERISVWIDRGNFDKVLMNILSNAFKFTRTGGEIIIDIKHDDQRLTISVSDDGEKIPEDKLDKIFERFYQTTSITNDRQAGTGIGLDLTRSLVELHHGTITAHNNQNGNGCTFIVTIPIGNAHLKPEEMLVEDKNTTDTPLYGIETIEEMEETDVVEQPVPSTLNRKRPTIVIAEDDTDIRLYLNNELKNDYRIIECADGKSALHVILKEIPALVVSDIMMPEMDGNLLCTKIKSNVNTNHIPVILLTAKSREEDQIEGLETGADAYITKPFNMDILRRTIINLLNARNLLRNKFTGKETPQDKIDDVKMKSPDERLLERVLAVINKNMDNSDLSVDMIAAEVGISRVHLHRKMKELTNQTPYDLIRNLRLKQAANLLANQHQNVTEVMYACGFYNSASFSTMFKNMYGMSPREYMKEHLDIHDEP